MSGRDHFEQVRDLHRDHGVESWHQLRKRLDRRFHIGAAAIGLLALTALLPPVPLLVWNVSSSAPIGLYLIRPGARAMRSDIVLARLTEPWRQLAAARRYLPWNVPLIKQVAAANGDMVCASGAVVSVNGRLVARRLPHDRHGRILPWWEGCHHLDAGEVFLLMGDKETSFDGRYFGVTRAEDVIGTARLLWAR